MDGQRLAMARNILAAPSALAPVLRGLPTQCGSGHHQSPHLAWPFTKERCFPHFNGHLLVGSLKFKRLYLVRLSAGVPQDELVIFDGSIGRVRDVAVAPDGAILLLSDEADGGLYRLAEAGQ